MICVGIDAASEKHDVCIANERGELLRPPFQIRNSSEDYKSLLETMRCLREAKCESQIRLGIESTGSYSETIVSYFSKVDWVDVVYINPLLTRMYQQTRKVHYAKTDRIDAAGIASFLATSPEVRTYSPIPREARQLREIYREIASINKEACECKNRLKSLIHLYFPEYLEVFSDLYGQSSLWVLDDIGSIEGLSRKSPEAYAKRVAKKSGGRMGEEKCARLIELAKASVGVADGFSHAVVSSLVGRIRALQGSKDSLLSEAEKLIMATFPNLLTIPGVGIVSAAGIIGEIGDIANFRSSDALYAFTGLDPRVYESGKYRAESVRISKKGSPYLRNALYIASGCIIRFDPVFQKYYEKKIGEGKRFRNALGHVAKKLCRVLWSLMRSGQDYVTQGQ